MERIINYEFLTKQLMEMYEKHDVLMKLLESEILHTYGNSDIQCINAIGRLEHPNVTKLALELKMTGGAISKITKRLIEDGSVLKYQIPENRKEVYFSLTDKGKEIFRAYEKSLKSWFDLKEAFFDTIPPEKLLVFSEVLGSFNLYMDRVINNFKP